jgi:hypothetical protein
MSTIKDLVENPHPIYRRYVNFWNFMLESYEGGIDYTGATIKHAQKSRSLLDSISVLVNGKKIEQVLSGNLFKHPKEKQEDYNDRISMSYYYNFCAPIIDIYLNHLFKQPIIADFKNLRDLIDIRKDNIDRKDSSLMEFRKEKAELAQLYGHVFTVIDKPDVEGLITKLDEIEKDAFPYFTLYHPQSVINWALDRFGYAHWVLLKEGEDTNTDPLNFDKDNLGKTNYRLWTRQEWFLYDAKYNEIGRGNHNLGAVPIVCTFNRRSKKAASFLGISDIADIGFICRDIYNSLSELKQILRDQTFAFLAIQGTSDEYKELSVGTSKALLYPVDRNPPQYVSPQAQNAEIYFTHIDRQISKIFQIAKLEGGSVKEQSALEQSGASKAWDFNQTNSALSQKAGNLEDGEMKELGVMSAWQGQKFEGSVQYPNEFSIQSLKEDLDEAEKSMRLNLGKLYNTEIKKGIIKKKFPRLGDDEVNAMVDEVKKIEESNASLNDRQKQVRGILDRVPLLKQNANSAGKREAQDV